MHRIAAAAGFLPQSLTGLSAPRAATTTITTITATTSPVRPVVFA